MSNDYKRFIVPLLFSVLGILGVFWLAPRLAWIVSATLSTFDIIPGIAGSSVVDINFLLVVLFPVLLIEFLILALPFAIIMLALAKVFRLATYNIDVMRIGKGFDWIRIMKRSVVPALFALSLGEIVISVLQGLIFAVPVYPVEDATVVVRNYYPLQTLLGGLLALIVAIAIFAPTWILNDAGIVAHVKPNHLELRRCPDTVGIGRWYSNLVGGFGILAFPITMFNRFFFQKFINNAGAIDPADLPLEIFWSLIWIVGLPIMVMAFIIPIIILNELTINSTSNVMGRIARRIGASDVQLQQVGTLQPLDSQMMSEMESLSDSMEESDV